MYLLVGLGNPGEKYKLNRHNIGYEVINQIALDYGFPEFQKKFSGLCAKGSIYGISVALFKPQTYMNNSGIPTLRCREFYKIANSKIIAVHDDLDLIIGKIKIKQGGGHGGHNGLKSMDQMLGNDYFRLRFGVSKPDSKSQVISHVLGNFTVDEQNIVDIAKNLVSNDIRLILENQQDKFLNTYYNQMREKNGI